MSRTPLNVVAVMAVVGVTCTVITRAQVSDWGLAARGESLNGLLAARREDC
jgi:hypothetical protein